MTFFVKQMIYNTFVKENTLKVYIRLTGDPYTFAQRSKSIRSM